MRRGITLLEVLISAAILVIGLLSIGALMTLGIRAAGDARKSDYSANLGRNAMADLRVRGFLDAANWSSGPLVADVPFVIDPLRLATDPGAVAFPATGPVQFSRITIQRPYGPMSLEEAQRIFLGQDAVKFSRPDDSDERPRAINVWPGPPSYASDETWGPAPTDPKPLIPTYRNDCSWFLTVCPRRPHATISVVVLWHRNVEEQAFAVGVEFAGMKDVRLVADAPDAIPVKRNEWLLLVGYRGPGDYACTWQRAEAIASDAEYRAADGKWVTHATLAGPDWSWDGDGDMLPDADEAVVMPGVVNVFTRPVVLR